MTFTIGWPQGIWLALAAISVAAACAHHGQPRQDEYDGPAKVLDVLLMTLLLYWGGFFS